MTPEPASCKAKPRSTMHIWQDAFVLPQPEPKGECHAHLQK